MDPFTTQDPYWNIQTAQDRRHTPLYYPCMHHVGAPGVMQQALVIPLGAAEAVRVGVPGSSPLHVLPPQVAGGVAALV